MKKSALWSEKVVVHNDLESSKQDRETRSNKASRAFWQLRISPWIEEEEEEKKKKKKKKKKKSMSRGEADEKNGWVALFTVVSCSLGDCDLSNRRLWVLELGNLDAEGAIHMRSGDLCRIHILGQYHRALEAAMTALITKILPAAARTAFFLFLVLLLLLATKRRAHSCRRSRRDLLWRSRELLHRPRTLPLIHAHWWQEHEAIVCAVEWAACLVACCQSSWPSRKQQLDLWILLPSHHLRKQQSQKKRQPQQQHRRKQWKSLKEEPEGREVFHNQANHKMNFHEHQRRSKN